MLYSRPTKVMEPELPENKEKFLKAKNLHSKMSIYFDENFYSPKRNDENCYKYLYLIYYMLACNKRYFHSYEDYDQYAQFAASTIYMRFLKKLENGERIKSVLNYAKATLYPLKVMYQNSEFNESIDSNKYDVYAIQEAFKENVQYQYYSDELNEEILGIFQEIPSMLWKIVLESPYRDDKVMCKRIYISCVLTLLKSFTLSNYNKERIDKKLSKPQAQISEKVLFKMYNKEREMSTTLWRLNSSMGDYIQVLTNKVRKQIMDEISKVKDSATLSDDTLNAILISGWESGNYQNNYEDID